MTVERIMERIHNGRLQFQHGACQAACVLQVGNSEQQLRHV